jgi:hypothetical protein
LQILVILANERPFSLENRSLVEPSQVKMRWLLCTTSFVDIVWKGTVTCKCHSALNLASCLILTNVSVSVRIAVSLSFQHLLPPGCPLVTQNVVRTFLICSFWKLIFYWFDELGDCHSVLYWKHSKTSLIGMVFRKPVWP